MPAPLSRQLCERIARKYAVRKTGAQIARELMVDRKTVADVLDRWRRGAPLTRPVH